jgi:prepilin-type N-terminal cleavage/methylation domain-containing protein
VVAGRQVGLDAGVMMSNHHTRRSGEDGFTLMETLFSLVILLIVAAGVMPLALVAVRATENQGHLAARTTEYAQDKLEQLMALAYADSSSDTRQFPAPDVGGSGLTIGGSANADAPVALYVDYLDADGQLMNEVDDGSTSWYYKRVWSITSPRANLKLITVTATVRVGTHGGVGEVPRSTVSAMKTDPF